MTQLTLQEIPIEDAIKSGDAVLAQWDEYDVLNEVGWVITCYDSIRKLWVDPEDWSQQFLLPPSRVFALPGGVE